MALKLQPGFHNALMTVGKLIVIILILGILYLFTLSVKNLDKRVTRLENAPMAVEKVNVVSPTATPTATLAPVRRFVPVSPVK